MEGSDLYARSMSYYESKEDDGGALQHKVWDKTPWMVDAFTGGCGDERDRDIRDWCEDNFGPEAWPIHGKEGRWHRGGATVYGYTWIGFDTKEAMERFVDAWPDPSLDVDSKKARPD